MYINEFKGAVDIPDGAPQLLYSETQLKAPQTSKMESFATTVNGSQALPITAKFSILDVCGGPSYASATLRVITHVCFDQENTLKIFCTLHLSYSLREKSFHETSMKPKHFEVYFLNKEIRLQLV